MNMEKAWEHAKKKASIALEAQLAALEHGSDEEQEKWGAIHHLYSVLEKKCAEMLDWSIETGFTANIEWVKDEVSISGHVELNMVKYLTTYEAWLQEYLKIEARL